METALLSLYFLFPKTKGLQLFTTLYADIIYLFHTLATWFNKMMLLQMVCIR